MKQIQRISISVLEFDTDVFIVPIKSFVTNEMDLPEEKIKYINQIGTLNGIGKLNYDSDQLIQLQFVSKDLDTTSLVFQGADVLDENGYICNIKPEIDILPANLFEGCMENDKIVLRVPYKMNDGHEITLIMNTTLKQKEYCYKKCGTFEEVWKYVTSAIDTSKPIKTAANSCEAAYLEN